MNCSCFSNLVICKNGSSCRGCSHCQGRQHIRYGRDGRDGRDGPVGPAGLTGPAGPAGPTGPTGNNSAEQDDAKTICFAKNINDINYYFLNNTNIVRLPPNGEQPGDVVGNYLYFYVNNIVTYPLIKIGGFEINKDYLRCDWDLNKTYKCLVNYSITGIIRTQEGFYLSLFVNGSKKSEVYSGDSFGGSEEDFQVLNISGVAIVDLKGSDHIAFSYYNNMSRPVRVPSSLSVSIIGLYEVQLT